MIQLGNFRFDDNELKDLPSVGDNEKIGDVVSFKASAIGNADGETIPVLVTYKIGMVVDVETEEDIDRRLSSIESSISNLEEEKTKKQADKDKIKAK